MAPWCHPRGSLSWHSVSLKSTSSVASWAVWAGEFVDKSPCSGGRQKSCLRIEIWYVKQSIWMLSWRQRLSVKVCRSKTCRTWASGCRGTRSIALSGSTWTPNCRERTCYLLRPQICPWSWSAIQSADRSLAQWELGAPESASFPSQSIGYPIRLLS